MAGQGGRRPPLIADPLISSSTIIATTSGISCNKYFYWKQQTFVLWKQLALLVLLVVEVAVLKVPPILISLSTSSLPHTANAPLFLKTISFYPIKHLAFLPCISVSIHISRYQIDTITQTSLTHTRWQSKVKWGLCEGVLVIVGYLKI